MPIGVLNVVEIEKTTLTKLRDVKVRDKNLCVECREMIPFSLTIQDVTTSDLMNFITQIRIDQCREITFRNFPPYAISKFKFIFEEGKDIVLHVEAQSNYVVYATIPSDVYGKESILALRIKYPFKIDFKKWDTTLSNIRNVLSDFGEKYVYLIEDVFKEVVKQFCKKQDFRVSDVRIESFEVKRNSVNIVGVVSIEWKVCLVNFIEKDYVLKKMLDNAFNLNNRIEQVCKKLSKEFIGVELSKCRVVETEENYIVSFGLSNCTVEVICENEMCNKYVEEIDHLEYEISKKYDEIRNYLIEQNIELPLGIEGRYKIELKETKEGFEILSIQKE